MQGEENLISRRYSEFVVTVSGFKLYFINSIVFFFACCSIICKKKSIEIIVKFRGTILFSHQFLRN